MPEELKAQDIGLTPDEARRLEAFTSAVKQVVDDGLSARGFVDENAVKDIVQATLRSELTSRLPTPEGEKERAKLDFYGKFFRALFEQDRAALCDLWEKHPEQWQERATLVSGATTYTNITPALIYNDILEYAKEVTWHRQYCRVLPGAPRSGIFPVGASTRCTAYRRTEGAATTDSAPQMGGHAFTCIPLSVQLPVSNELLEEWAIPVFYNWVVSEMGYAKAIKEFTEFQTGTDSSQWNGIENAGLTAVTGSTSDNLDLLGDLYYGVPAAFRTQSVYWANAATLAKIWRLKDGAGRRYFDANTPMTQLFGRPLLECSVATNELVFFGWLNRYHIYVGEAKFVADKTGATNVTQNQTMFFLNESNDAGPADTNAFRYVTLM